MEIKKDQRIHDLLFLTAFVVALAFRFIQLAQPALSDMEASFALQARAVAEGTTPIFSDQISYIGLTSLLFFIFKAGDFWARFWPALIGALVVLIPFLFQRWIGRFPAILLAFILAISPEMVGLSRVIGSPMMAMVFLLLAVGFFTQRKPILTGITLALGLMSGTGFWLGILIFGITYLLSIQNMWTIETFQFSPISKKRKFWSQLGISFALTVLIVGTCFLMAPAGLTGVFSGLIELIRGFRKGHIQPYGLLLVVMMTTMAPALLLGLWSGIRGVLTRSKKEIFLLTWFLVGLAIMLLLPGVQPADMLWVSLPLWTLSVRVLSNAWQTWKYERKIVIFTAILTIISLAFLALSMRSLVNFTPQNSNYLNAIIAIVAGIALIAAILFLVGFGWSKEVALSGFLVGVVVVMGVVLISSSINSTGINPNPHYELWYPEQASQSPKLLMKTIAQIVDWNESSGLPVEIAVIDYDTQAIRWALHQHQPVDYVPYLPPQSQVGMIISDDQTMPEIAESYRGQDLVISRLVPWQDLTARQYLTWWMTREVPAIADQIIVWVRTDLMPDTQFSP